MSADRLLNRKIKLALTSTNSYGLSFRIVWDDKTTIAIDERFTQHEVEPLASPPGKQ
jgi:hypothetical protein